MRNPLTALLRAITNTPAPAPVRVNRRVRPRAVAPVLPPVAGVLTLVTCHWCNVTTQRTADTYRRCPRCGFVH